MDQEFNEAACLCNAPSPATGPSWHSRKIPFYLAQRWVRVERGTDRTTGITSITVDYVVVAEVADSYADAAFQAVCAAIECIGTWER